MFKSTFTQDKKIDLLKYNYNFRIIVSIIDFIDDNISEIKSSEFYDFRNIKPVRHGIKHNFFLPFLNYCYFFKRSV